MKTAGPPLPPTAMDDPPSSASAVRIDLTAADKSIRRPGSAPDLHSAAAPNNANPSAQTASGGRAIKGSLKQQRSLDRNEIKRRGRRVHSVETVH